MDIERPETDQIGGYVRTPPPPLLAGRLKNDLVTSSWKPVRSGMPADFAGVLARYLRRDPTRRMEYRSPR